MDEVILGKYVHFKGGRYQALMLAQHTETEEQMVIYRSLSAGAEDTVFARPVAMWREVVQWPDGEKRPRFVLEEEDTVRQSISTNLADL